MAAPHVLSVVDRQVAPASRRRRTEASICASDPGASASTA
jgi:hypothetical protein